MALQEDREEWTGSADEVGKTGKGQACFPRLSLAPGVEGLAEQ